MEWNPSEDYVNTRAHSEIDRLHSFKISNMDNVYPLLPGTRIRLEVIGEMFEDGRWKEIHRKPLARVQAYDIYYHRAKQARASRPPASPAPSPPPALRCRRRVNLRRVPPTGKEKAFSAQRDWRPLQRKRKAIALFYSAHDGPRRRLCHRKSPPTTNKTFFIYKFYLMKQSL